MPPKWIIDKVCAPVCVWHKPGKKENSICGGAMIINSLGENRIGEKISGGGAFENRNDGALYDLVCAKCSFIIDGCDFRGEKKGRVVFPCGGYVILDRLLCDGSITADEIAICAERVLFNNEK